MSKVRLPFSSSNLAVVGNYLREFVHMGHWNNKEWLWSGAMLFGSTFIAIRLVTLSSDFDWLTGMAWLGMSIQLIAIGYIFQLTWLKPRMRSHADDGRVSREELASEFKEAEIALKRQADILDQRQQVLAERVLHFESVMEFPLGGMEDLREEIAEDLDSKSTNEAIDREVGFASASPSESRELERRVTDFLQKESERIFDRIKANDFSKDGEVDLDEIRNELMHVIQTVARIYNPDSKNPLLETSVEQLLRATSRLCLHLLVLVERLPVNVASYNLQSLYAYLSRAFKAYKAYQHIRPVLPYVQYATYAGRIALGANPITMGASWALWKLGSEGASAAAKHLVNRQAIGFLNDAIAVVGYEVAGLYGTDLRYRNKYWIYACELSEMLSRFPVSRESLVAAMVEVGELPLRNEYDRVFLYRLLAAHRSAVPRRFSTRAELSTKEKEWIAKRIEKHFHRFFQGRKSPKIGAWRSGFEKRLNVQLQLNESGTSLSDQELAFAMSEQLARFLIQFRQIELQDLEPLLSTASLYRKLKTPSKTELLAHVKDDLESEFEVPDVDPKHEMTALFIRDIASLTARTASQSEGEREAMEWIGSSLGLSEKIVQAALDQAFREEVKRRSVEGAHLEKAHPSIDELLLEMAEAETQIQFVYRNVRVMLEGKLERDYQPAYLLGWDDRCAIVVGEEEPEPVWISDRPFKVESSRKWMQAQAVITGGRWLKSNLENATIELKYGVGSQVDQVFHPLIEMSNRIERST